MTRVVLVRHGETVWHDENRYAGVSDVPLTERGLAQAGQLAEWARSAGLDAVWASPLHRARETAMACGQVCVLPVSIDDRLREIDFGAAEGLTSSEMAVRFPAALRAFRADPVVHHLPGGEDPVAAAQRFVAALHAIGARNPHGKVLVVAHTTVIRLALCQLIGLPLSEYRRVFPGVHNCSLTEIRLDGNESAVMEFNTPIRGKVLQPTAPVAHQVRTLKSLRLGAGLPVQAPLTAVTPCRVLR